MNVIRITPKRLKKVELALGKLSGEVGKMAQHDSVLVVGGIQIDNIIYIYIRCWKKRI